MALVTYRIISLTFNGYKFEILPVKECHIYSCNKFVGMLRKSNPNNDLCEISAEGPFVAGMLHGKIRYILNILFIVHTKVKESFSNKCYMNICNFLYFQGNSFFNQV